jgi:hypothetical protein
MLVRHDEVQADGVGWARIAGESGFQIGGESGLSSTGSNWWLAIRQGEPDKERSKQIKQAVAG